MTKVNIRFSTHKCVLKSQTTLKMLSTIWFVENWFGFYVCLILHDGKFDVRWKKMFVQCAMETEKICLEITVSNMISTLLTLIKLSKITYFMPQIRKSVEYQLKINQKKYYTLYNFNSNFCRVIPAIQYISLTQYSSEGDIYAVVFFPTWSANAQHHYYIKYKTASILIERDQCRWSVTYKMYASVRLPYNKSGPFERKWNKKNMHPKYYAESFKCEMLYNACINALAFLFTLQKYMFDFAYCAQMANFSYMQFYFK